MTELAPALDDVGQRLAERLSARSAARGVGHARQDPASRVWARTRDDGGAPGASPRRARLLSRVLDGFGTSLPTWDRWGQARGQTVLRVLGEAYVMSPDGFVWVVPQPEALEEAARGAGGWARGLRPTPRPVPRAESRPVPPMQEAVPAAATEAMAPTPHRTPTRRRSRAVSRAAARALPRPGRAARGAEDREGGAEAAPSLAAAYARLDAAEPTRRRLPAAVDPVWVRPAAPRDDRGVTGDGQASAPGRASSRGGPRSAPARAAVRVAAGDAPRAPGSWGDPTVGEQAAAAAARPLARAARRTGAEVVDAPGGRSLVPRATGLRGTLSGLATPRRSALAASVPDSVWLSGGSADTAGTVGPGGGERRAERTSGGAGARRDGVVRSGPGPVAGASGAASRGAQTGADGVASALTGGDPSGARPRSGERVGARGDANTGGPARPGAAPDMRGISGPDRAYDAAPTGVRAPAEHAAARADRALAADRRVERPGLAARAALSPPPMSWIAAPTDRADARPDPVRHAQRRAGAGSGFAPPLAPPSAGPVVPDTFADAVRARREALTPLRLASRGARSAPVADAGTTLDGHRLTGAEAQDAATTGVPRRSRPTTRLGERGALPARSRPVEPPDMHLPESASPAEAAAPRGAHVSISAWRRALAAAPADVASALASSPELGARVVAAMRQMRALPEDAAKPLHARTTAPAGVAAPVAAERDRRDKTAAALSTLRGSPMRTRADRGGGTRLTRLATKLEGLVHLVESEQREAEAQRWVRRASEPAAAGPAASAQAASGAADVSLDALQREVLQAVLRELERNQERGEGIGHGTADW